MQEKLLHRAIYRLMENPDGIRPDFFVQGKMVDEKLEVGMRCMINVYESPTYEDHNMQSVVQLESGAACTLSGDITRPDYSDCNMVFKFLKMP